jgi:hypothetical protein
MEAIYYSETMVPTNHITMHTDSVSSEVGVNMFLRKASTPLPVYNKLAQFLSEDGDNMFLRNAGTHLLKCMVSQPKKSKYEWSLP